MSFNRNGFDMKKIILAMMLAFSVHTTHAAYPSFADMNSAIAAAIAGLGTNSSGGLGAGVPIKSPNIYWTNNVFRSFWITNQTFTSAQVGLASSNFYVSQITISNSSPSAYITNIFPITAYSLSMKTNVGSALIAPGSALDLQFYYNGTSYFVADKGANDATLSSLAAAGLLGSSGILSINGTTITVVAIVPAASVVPSGIIITNPVIATITTPATEWVAQETGDSSGTVRLHLQNRFGVNGGLIENASLDLSEFVLRGSSGVQGNFRFEHRAGALSNPKNVSGELQFFLNMGTNCLVLGTNSDQFFQPVYAPQIVITNLGEIYTSNTWNIVSITNNMPNFSFQTANSNGQALVSISVSNGVTRIKQLMP
jgi:hypothetical protein